MPESTPNLQLFNDGEECQCSWARLWGIMIAAIFVFVLSRHWRSSMEAHSHSASAAKWSLRNPNLTSFAIFYFFGRTLLYSLTDFCTIYVSMLVNHFALCNEPKTRHLNRLFLQNHEIHTQTPCSYRLKRSFCHSTRQQ